MKPYVVSEAQIEHGVPLAYGKALSFPLFLDEEYIHTYTPIIHTQPNMHIKLYRTNLAYLRLIDIRRPGTSESRASPGENLCGCGGGTLIGVYGSKVPGQRISWRHFLISETNFLTKLSNKFGIFRLGLQGGPK